MCGAPQSGLIAGVDKPRARTSLFLDRSVLQSHGLIDPEAILKEHENTVLDVTMPKDDKIFVKLKPASSSRKNTAGKSSAAR